MDTAKIRLLEAGLNEFGKPWARVRLEPLIGDPKTNHTLLLNEGDTMTLDMPVAPACKHKWTQYATHLSCERCNESIGIDCP